MLVLYTMYVLHNPKILIIWGLPAVNINSVAPDKVSENSVNIGSGNGLLLDSNNPLPESILTCHTEGLVAVHLRRISQELLEISVTNMHETYTCSLIWQGLMS